MTGFDCRQFARWLDDGGAVGGSPEADVLVASRARTHAAECRDCGELLAGEQAVLSFLRGGEEVAILPPIPGGFADRVMRQVAVTPQRTAPRLPVFATLPLDVLPWWIRAVAQPASVLALTLAGVAVAFVPQLLGVSRSAPAWSADALAVLAGVIAPWGERANAMVGSDPLIAAVVMLALLPLLALVAIGLYRLGAMISTAHFATIVPHPSGIRRA